MVLRSWNNSLVYQTIIRWASMFQAALESKLQWRYCSQLVWYALQDPPNKNVKMNFIPNKLWWKIVPEWVKKLFFKYLETRHYHFRAPTLSRCWPVYREVIILSTHGTHQSLKKTMKLFALQKNTTKQLEIRSPTCPVSLTFPAPE